MLFCTLESGSCCHTFAGPVEYICYWWGQISFADQQVGLHGLLLEWSDGELSQGQPSPPCGRTVWVKGSLIW